MCMYMYVYMSVRMYRMVVGKQVIIHIRNLSRDCIPTLKLQTKGPLPLRTQKETKQNGPPLSRTLSRAHKPGEGNELFP